MDDLVIGIDLGTTNSCISLYKKGKLKILENPEGERTTPTFIFFQPDGGVIFGKHAPKMASNRTENGIYGKILLYLKQKTYLLNCRSKTTGWKNIQRPETSRKHKIFVLQRKTRRVQSSCGHAEAKWQNCHQNATRSVHGYFERTKKVC